MNARARAALVRASRAGVRHIVDRLADDTGGRSAVGILMEEVGVNFSLAKLEGHCLILSPTAWFDAEQALRYQLEIEPHERAVIVHMDNAGETFLAIAGMEEGDA